MMVVPVLITSCQVSEYLKIGPVTAQTMMMRTARMNAQADPTIVEVLCANFLNSSCISSHLSRLLLWRQDPPGHQTTQGETKRIDYAVTYCHLWNIND